MEEQLEIVSAQVRSVMKKRSATHLINQERRTKMTQSLTRVAISEGEVGPSTTMEEETTTSGKLLGRR